MNNRIVYLDRLKGFTILTVIMGHLDEWSFALSGPIHQFIYSFHMHLFMFLSGFVISNAPDIKKSFRKSIKYWAPFLTIGILKTVYSGDPLSYFFSLPYKEGYWFLYVLGIFYFLMIPFKYCRKKITVLSAGIIIFSVILVLMYLFNEKTVCITSINMLGIYWPYFFCGYFFRKFNYENKLFSNNLSFTISLICFILLYSCFQGEKYYKQIISFSAIIFIVSLFKFRENKESFIEKKLTQIGGKTLDIYIYHFFFFFGFLKIDLSQVGIWIHDTNNYFIELIILMLLAVFISYICIGWGYVIRQSTILRRIIYGE